MENNGPFGFDPDDIDRVVREASEGLRDASGDSSAARGKVPRSAACSTSSPGTRGPRSQPETAGEAGGDGVWAIYTTDAAGKAHVEQVYRNELDALRANKHNTDPPTRNVRFLPYGIDVSVLDASENSDSADGETE